MIEIPESSQLDVTEFTAKLNDFSRSIVRKRINLVTQLRDMSLQHNHKLLSFVSQTVDKAL